MSITCRAPLRIRASQAPRRAAARAGQAARGPVSTPLSGDGWAQCSFDTHGNLVCDLDNSLSEGQYMVSTTDSDAGVPDESGVHCRQTNEGHLVCTNVGDEQEHLTEWGAMTRVNVSDSKDAAPADRTPAADYLASDLEGHM